MRKTNLKYSNRGFTLIEVLVATVVLLLVLLAVYELFDQGRWLYVGTENQAANLQNVRIVSENLERDLRMAGGGVPLSVSTDTKFWTPMIFTADKSEIFFHADIDSRTTLFTADAAANSVTVEDAALVCPEAAWPLVFYDSDARKWQSVQCNSFAGSTINFSPAAAISFPAASSTVYSPETVFYRLTNDSDADGVCDDVNGDGILCTAPPDPDGTDFGGRDFPFCSIERAVVFGNDPTTDRDDTAATFETLASNICVFQLAYFQTDGTPVNGGTFPVTGGFLQGIHRVTSTITSKSRSSQGPGKYQEITLTSDILVRSAKY
ncbi:MAG: prepilin-type N-terminal cleavage/methylation domain-containing protein [Anaerolineae bacterium]|nr:prepilin-type N-terminal cleavage/methylation domain-containing protein [Anaerolineae bacterium]MCI0604683.1 prepilin-type N-terminal cleavage/methylation domain-containing protein [bacterium]